MSGTRLPPNLGAHSRRVTELFRPLPLAEHLADSLILLLRYVDAAGIAAYATSSRSARRFRRFHGNTMAEEAAKPSFLGLLNGIALAEEGAGVFLSAWAVRALR